MFPIASAILQPLYNVGDTNMFPVCNGTALDEETWHGPVFSLSSSDLACCDRRQSERQPSSRHRRHLNVAAGARRRARHGCERGPPRRRRDRAEPVGAIEEASKKRPPRARHLSSGVIRSRAVDAAIAALENFRRVLDGYGVQRVQRRRHQRGARARNGDVFLDRIQGRTGIAFEIINEAESRLVFLAVRRTLGRTRRCARVDAARGVGGGGDDAAAKGPPNLRRRRRRRELRQRSTCGGDP